MRIANDWSKEARQLGYKSAKEMFTDLYVTKRMTLSEIGNVLSASPTAINMAITNNGIQLRGRGGPNNTKSVLDAIDDLELFTEKPLALAARLNVNKSLIYKERAKRAGVSGKERKVSGDVVANPEDHQD